MEFHHEWYQYLHEETNIEENGCFNLKKNPVYDNLTIHHPATLENYVVTFPFYK